MNGNETTPSEAKPVSSLQKTLRWVLVALLAFGLGALLIALVLYFPARQKFSETSLDLEHVNTVIASQTDQISTLQTGKATLQKNLESTTLHMHLLNALSGVRGASLAIAAEDYAGARLSLSQASEALDTLIDLLDTDQKDVLTAMQMSADQASTDMQTNLKSAQPVLAQLTKNLVQLEANLFPTP